MYLKWWQGLEEQWQKAFCITQFGDLHSPNQEQLIQLYHSKILRLVGPSAAFPNMNFELTNMSGLAALEELEILVLAHHEIQEIEYLENKKSLKSLFLFNNQINSLKGVESLVTLEQLYVQNNKIQSIAEVKDLVSLKELYIHDNEITALDGINDRHENILHVIACRPNTKLSQKEILRIERDFGIRCV